MNSDAIINMYKSASGNLSSQQARKIWKKFYSLKNFNSRYRCGTECLFFDKDGKPSIFTFFDACMMQGRVIRYLSKIGFKIHTKGSTAVNKAIYTVLALHAHEACQPERLSEKDYCAITEILQ